MARVKKVAVEKTPLEIEEKIEVIEVKEVKEEIKAEEKRETKKEITKDKKTKKEINKVVYKFECDVKSFTFWHGSYFAQFLNGKFETKNIDLAKELRKHRAVREVE